MKHTDQQHPLDRFVGSAHGVLRRLARTAALVGALHGGAALAAEPLRMAVSTGPLSLLIYVAKTQGHFEAESVAVRIDDCLGGNRCLNKLFDGSADLATTSELPVVFSAFERSDYAIVATIASATDSPKLIGGKGVTSIGDLGGKRVGVVAQTSSQYVLDLSLLAAGVDPRTLAMVALKPEEMVEALRTGRVDAISVWEPFAFIAIQGGEGKPLPIAAAYTTTFNIVAHRAALKNRSGDLVKLMRALARAESFIAEHPREARAILRQRLQLEPAVIDAVMPGTVYKLALHQSLLATMEGEARWALREGHVRKAKRPNFMQFIDTAALQAAKPAAVGIGR